MRAELYRPGAPDTVVAVARWREGAADLESRDEALKGLDRIFRPTPVVVDDPALRRPGTSGEALLQPGDLEWFRAALLARAPELGLVVRFVPEVAEGGWDPASLYRTLEEQVDRLASG